MRNVFFLYMPPGNPEAMVHYEDTIRRRVRLERIRPFVSRPLATSLQHVFGAHPIAVWGSRRGPKNQTYFDRMRSGDDVIIVEGKRVRLIGKVAAKVESRELSRELWRPLAGDETEPWELVYFIANAREVDVAFEQLGSFFGYAADFQLRGLHGVAADHVADFFRRYDDLYSILVRLQAGQPILERSEASTGVDDASAPLPLVGSEDVDQVLRGEAISDHVRIQWTLARLGLKAGEKVWVPAGDQRRLQRAYQFDAFDRQFTAGIDLPHSYVENIDVVWKQEFRIAAAYEIENSTAIYSGLLRFADLTVLAPNSIYPLFLVAPAGRKNQAREQVRRPAFRRLDLSDRVRFLSYETIEEIDQDFERYESGLSVELIASRSEPLAA